MPVVLQSAVQLPLNPCRDYFAPSEVLSPLVAGTTAIPDGDLLVNHAFHSSVAQLRIGGKLITEPVPELYDPDTYSPGVTIELPNRSFPYVDRRTYLAGFSYQISAELEVNVVLSGGGLAAQSFPLLARRNIHFAFFLFRPEVNKTVTGLQFVLDAYRGTPDYSRIGPPPIPEVNLSNFVIYDLYDYDVRYQLSGGETGWLEQNGGVWQATGQAVLPGKTWANFALTRRQQPTGDLETFTSLSRPSALNPANYVFVFPGQERDGHCTFQVVRYVSRLDYYGLLAKRPMGGWTALSIEEQWLLDADKFRPLLPPRTGRRAVDWAVRCEPVTNPFATWVNAPGILNLDDLLHHFQRIGFSTLFADTSGRSAAEVPALQERLLTFGLRLAFAFPWQSALVLGGSSGRFRLSRRKGDGTLEGANNLFKNPLLNDVLEIQAISERFLEQNPGMTAAVALDGSNPAMIETPEIGDTQAGLPFALAPVAGEADPIAAVRSGLAESQYVIERSSGSASTWFGYARVENAPIAADVQYQSGFLPFLVDQLDHLVRFQKSRPQSTGFAWFDVEDVQESLEAMVGWRRDPVSEEFVFDFARLGSIVPGNGPHGPTEYNWPLPLKGVVGRRNAAIAGRASNEDAVWYLQHRYWTQMNVAYLCAADGALRSALRNIPLWHWSSLSKDFGYPKGYEPYQVAKSGALDIIWMDDDYTRTAAGWNHLIFSNVLADYARALARVPRAGLASTGKPLRIGAFVHSDRPDYKAIVWAARGARHFEQFYSGDAHFEGNGWGWGNSGLLAHQMLRQAKLAIDVLDRAAPGLSLTNRAAARIALVIPQSDSVWICQDSGSTIDDKGFVAQYSLTNDFHGLHAMLTHLQLPLDLVFEEELADKPRALDSYSIVFVSSLCLRDDSFYAIAAWVEEGNRVAVFAPVSRTDLGPKRIWPPSLFNEFARYRSSRGAWFGLEDVLPATAELNSDFPPDGWPSSGAEPLFVKRGLGCLMLLPTGMEQGKEKSFGEAYIDKIMHVAGPSFLARSTQEAGLLRGRLQACLADACRTAGLPLDWFDAWRYATAVRVPSASELFQPDLLVEVSCVHGASRNPWVFPSTPSSGAVFIVNHRQRPVVARPPGFDEADDAECTRRPDSCELTIKGLPRQVWISLCRNGGPKSGPLVTSGGKLTFRLDLQDYEILLWSDSADS